LKHIGLKTGDCMNPLLECAFMLLMGALVMGLADSAADAPLIPRELLFGNPDKAAARISPDGSRISYLAPVNGILNVWVGPADDPSAAKPVTRDTKRGIHEHFWAFTSRHIIYLQDENGDENWHVYSVNLESGEVRDLTPYKGVQARIQGVSHVWPHEVLIGLNNRNPQLHDIHRINLETGESSLLFQNDRYLGVMTDDQYRVRLGFALTAEGALSVEKILPEGRTQLLLTIGPEDVLTTTPIDFDKSGNVLYMLDSRGRNTAALVALDLATMKATAVAQNARVDLGGVMIHPTKKTLQAYSTCYERRIWHALNSGVGKDLEVLRGVADGDSSVVSRTLDDKTWIVAYTMDAGPVRYYRYDRRARRATFLFTNRRALEDVRFPHMHPVIVRSRDGRDLVSYLTLPLGSDGRHPGRPLRPLPLVLWVHGGPWGRDTWGFDPVHQWLANRGYGALSVNFRGSTGFGKEFVNASNHEWGGKMHDDLIDAVNWAVREKIADPAKVAIAGGSYGGYATLIGMTRTPETFACGVDIVGPSNLITFLNNVPEYWIPMLPLLTNRVGDNKSTEGQAFLKERSPLTYVDRITKPLLIGQGANDPRVPRRESDQIVHAMQEQKIPVTYVIYSDEGHGFARPENSVSFWAVAEAFLARHLDGRYQPIGSDFKGSTIQVTAGADQVPGLAEGLKESGR
jgi:dipeptidyl aminopeptidase/acylaminoacyl peptidase